MTCTTKVSETVPVLKQLQYWC